MKWVGILLIVLGFVAYVSLNAFESSLPLVQFVKNDAVVTNPVRTILPRNTQFVAGTGKDGAKFVSIDSDAAQYLNVSRLLGVAKIGTLLVCAFGAIGFAFEHRREKAKRLFVEHGVYDEELVQPEDLIR